VKFVCLVYGEESLIRSVPDADCMANGQLLQSKGHYIAAEALRPVKDAVTVRVRHGAVSITDGPFAETKEQLAGFYLIEAKDLEEAVQLASTIPPARIGSIEVRPVRELQA
jgi:hypothetical protein